MEQARWHRHQNGWWSWESIGQPFQLRVTVEAIQACAAGVIEVRLQPENGTLRVLGPFDGTDKNLVVVCASYGEALVVVTVHTERRKAK